MSGKPILPALSLGAQQIQYGLEELAFLET